MAEDEDGVSDKKSPQNSNNNESPQDNEQNTTKPDLGIEESKYNSSENGHVSPTEPRSSTSKSSGSSRKEENPFSFRHFLKRDLSLPGNSTYENTGARPKVYANTVQHSPTKLDIQPEIRRDRSRQNETQAKEKINDGSNHRISDNTSSSSSVEIPFSVVDNSDSKQNLYTDNCDVNFYHRPNLASEPLGMPSLPDFVQDHILVEQAYLNSNGPISVDLDNLPDFTFNTSFNMGAGASPGENRRARGNPTRHSGYQSIYLDSPSTSSDNCERGIPLDVAAGAEGAGAVQRELPLDLPPHLSLDLTESINSSERRNMSPSNTFPLDLPPNAGAESMRLPDFLPVHPGRTSPEPEHQDSQLREIMAELERTRSELFAERNRRSRVESELASAQASASSLREELGRECARAAAHHARMEHSRASDRVYLGQLDAAASHAEDTLVEHATRATEAEATIWKLRKEIKKLKEELAASREEVRSLRGVQSGAAADLRRAARSAEGSLRDLLAGLEQLRSLGNALEPPT